MRKYVYLMKSMDNNFYKIGTSKHPQKRLGENQTGNPSPIKLISKFKSSFATKIEKTLHRRYSHLNKSGEWFDLTLEQEFNFINECEEIEKNFIFLKNNKNSFI